MDKIAYNFFVKLELAVKNLTIHQRVALFTGSCLIGLEVVLILIINIIAPRFITISVSLPNTVKLVDTVDVKGNSITILVETPAPQGYTVTHESYLTNIDPINSLRFLSLVSLIVIAVIGVLASRWLARISLQPISIISQKAATIDAKSLNKRLNYQGPRDEVKTLADTIDVMLNRLDTNFEMQGQFIGNLAHELRTPLSSLRLNLEALILNPEASLEDYHKFSETAERALSRLEKLVEDLLLLAKGEQEIIYQPIVIGALVDEILEELAPIANEYNISLSINGDIDSELSGDAALLQCAIYNLVKNGVLYNHPGGFVDVLIRDENKKVIIDVRDDGIGIPEDIQAKIFERFYRANKGKSDRIVGKGLGLAIVEHIVELHQGNIEVESKLGVGSTFRVLLPSIEISEAGKYICRPNSQVQL